MGRRAEELQAIYERWSPVSRERNLEARKVMPGGDTRSSAHYPPYPLAMERGRGARIVDADGHELVDFMNNFTSLIHGHAHAPTMEAIRGQLARGTAHAAPTEGQTRLARLLADRVPSLDELRFCSSGSEATEMAVRAARAFTGRQKVVKMEGGYHGSHELGELSLVPIPGKAGPIESPETTFPDRSISYSAATDVITTPFNRPDVTRRQLEEHGDEVAALILEPMLGGLGMIPPADGVLAELRRITEEHEVILIFDEVITLRVSTGGVQEREGIRPDLTAMGKIIGGGLPVGAFGGRRDVMEIFNPDRRDAIAHASTFSGNALTMAAGLAALESLDADTTDRLNTLGEKLRAGIRAAFEASGLRGQATGMGSLSQVHWGDTPVTDARTSVLAFGGAGPLARLLHLGMLRRGVFAAGRQMYCTSTPMTGADVDFAIAAMHEALAELRPVAEEECPHLLA